ncbi:spore cortex biosynthesis protein YabQ [Parablautia sp. Marseille-Q6255]|uniref:spore cortex biosynthesis protein YabQ n=1 Tax=Parablautia sp. Marseille-Q6255 TaxID=3039593 RepID=UPI0024BCEB9F|nr:spore cortex biosynthesis protein YabQ [Parablautia sp. Marseille-Q6255]
MMSNVIRQETIVFFLSVLHGVLLAFGYDLFRALRKAVPHGLFAVSAEDFVYWITAGFLTFVFAFFYTDGVIRGYVAAGIAIGAVLYHFTVSIVVLRLFAAVFGLLRDVILLLRRAAGAPVRKIWSFFKKTIEFAGKKRYNDNKNEKIRGEGCGKKEKTSEHGQP